MLHPESVFRRLLAACVLAGCVSNLSAAPGDWPQWRGPNRDSKSTETGLLQEWPAGGPKLLWKARGLGGGYASVAVVGNRIYTLGESKGAGVALLALDRSGGSLVWSQRVGRAGAPGGYDGPRGTPTVVGDQVFALGQYGELGCFSTGDGTRKWTKHLVDDLGGGMPGWGYSESVLADGPRLIVTPGGGKGTLAALNPADGAVLWRSTEFKDNAHYSSPIVTEIDGARQYIQLTDRSVAGVGTDGAVLWRVPRKGEVAVIPTPVYADHRVYVTSGYGVGCHAFAIKSEGGKFSGTQVYASKAMVNHHGGVILLGGNVYGHSDSKGWTCQDFLTGEVRWVEKQKLGKGAVTYADGRLYCRAEDGPGTVVLLEATTEGYREKGRFNPPDRSRKNSWSHPVVAGGKLYLRDQDVLLCYDIKAP